MRWLRPVCHFCGSKEAEVYKTEDGGCFTACAECASLREELVGAVPITDCLDDDDEGRQRCY